jgi:glycosyltransferase involved in cell wall biosynthesis
MLIGRERNSSTPLDTRTFQQKRIRCFFNKGFLFYAEYNIRLFLLLVFHGADIYGAADTDTLPANTLATLVRSRKLTYDAHEYFAEVPELAERNFVKSIWRKIEQLCIPVSVLNYTVSESLAEIFSKDNKKVFHVIRNLPPASTLPVLTTRTNEKFTFIYQGDLNMGRGLEEVIIGMKSLDAVLWIAGDGPLASKLKYLIKAENLENKVIMLGYLKPEDLMKKTREADAGLNLLANKGLSYYYSLSNKFFNYIQAGIPQICSDFPEYHRINTKIPVAVLTNLSTEHFVESAKILMDHPETYQTLKSSCIKAATVYTWEKESETLIQLYNDL